MPLGRMDPTCSGDPGYLLSEESREKLDMVDSVLRKENEKEATHIEKCRCFIKLREKNTLYHAFLFHFVLNTSIFLILDL